MAIGACAGEGGNRHRRRDGMSAFGRLGKVEEIADVVACVVSDDGRWVTGQNIRVNGGTV